MKIKKETGRIIEAHYIGGTLVSLVPFKNTSAPCGNCHFFDNYQLKCVFPGDKSKECKVEEGSIHGWNTIEYVPVFLEVKDEIIPVNI